jgi:hypothetical protein
MTSTRFPKTTFSDTSVQKRPVTDAISMIDPTETPIQAYFGIKDTPPPDWKLQGWPNNYAEWVQDSLIPRSDLLNEDLDISETGVDQTNGAYFHVGDVIQIDSEYMWVSSISGNTLTVVRAFAGTSAATHSTGATTYIRGQARLEGAEFDLKSFTTLVSYKNYIQTFEAAIKVTRHEEKMSQYGIAGAYEYQRMKAVKEAALKLEQGYLYGLRNIPTDNTAPRAMGGFYYWLNLQPTTQKVNAGGAVTQAHFDTALLNCYNNGGNPKLAFVSPSNMLVIRNWYANSSYLRVAQDETQVGMVVNKIISPFGELDLVMHRHMRNSEIFILDPDHIALLAYENWFEKDLPATGDYTQGEILGDFTLLFRQHLNAHSMIYGIS